MLLSYTFAGSQCLQFNVLNTGNVYTFSSPENTGDNGELLGTVTCTENGGASLNGPVTYAILQPESLPFVLDGSTDGTSGILSLMTGEILNYEITEQYMFDIFCSYDSDSLINATAIVTFLVRPVNEFEPVFGDVSLQVFVSETTPIGTVLVARDQQYTVSDRDSGPDGELRFLPSTANPPELDQDFSLSMSGSLTLNQIIELDTGTTPVKRVTYQISVCDGNRVETDCPYLDVLLLISSENDNPPMFEKNEYAVTISESAPIGTSLITVLCTDADRNGVGEFSGITVQEPNAPVHERNGTIFLKDNLDFENSSVVTIALVCLDSGGLQDIATLVITVTPENDGVPSFSRTLFECTVCRLAIISEEICEVQAIDTDNDIITYALAGPGSENFQIRPDGVLVLNDIVLVAEGSFFDLTVTASDGIFNTSTTVRLAVDCLLSIPEIIIVAVCGVVLILVVIIVTVICCCCFIGCYRW